jgi:selenide,water dikinase
VELAEVVGWMKQLNLAACALATSCSLRAATDITGFGLLGHLSEMITASGCGARLRMSAIPLVSCARKYALTYTFPGGASDNRLYFEPQVQFAQEISEDQRMLLFDPQTSGGLLLAVPEEKLSLFQRSAEAAGTPTWEIGLIEAGPGIQVLA